MERLAIPSNLLRSIGFFPAKEGIPEIMAELNLKWPENVAGKYYVDEECIDCNLCSEIAPDNFKVNEEEGHDFVYKQPLTDEEEDLCVEALESCPVEAIGNDGKSSV